MRIFHIYFAFERFKGSPYVQIHTSYFRNMINAHPKGGKARVATKSLAVFRLMELFRRRRASFSGKEEARENSDVDPWKFTWKANACLFHVCVCAFRADRAFPGFSALSRFRMQLYRFEKIALSFLVLGSMRFIILTKMFSVKCWCLTSEYVSHSIVVFNLANCHFR